MRRVGLMAVLAVMVGFPAAGRAADDEQKVIDAIRERGGTVEIDESLPGKPVVAVSLRNRNADEGDVKLLKPLEHLRRLDLATDGVQLGADMVEVVPLLSGLDSLQEIDLSGGLLRGTEVPDLTGLRKLKNLRKLNLSRLVPAQAFLGDWKDTLDQLSGVESLEALDLSGNELRGVINDTLDPIKKFKNLRELALADTQLAADDLKPLKGLDKMRSLDLSGLPVDDDLLAELRGMKELERLELRGARVSGRGIKAFPKLRRLNLAGAGPDAEGIKEIAALPGLEDLSLAHTPLLGSVALEDIRPLAGVKTLRRLDLSGNGGLTGKVFDLFKDSPALEELDLSLTHAADKDPGPLAGFTALRVLRLAAVRNRTGPNINFDESFVEPGAGDEAVARVAALSALEHLDLTGAPVTDAALKPLAAAPKLRRLVLDRTKVTDAGLKTVAASPTLRRLELARTAVTDAGVLTLKDAPALEELDVSYTKVTDAGMKTIGTMTPLTYLDVSGTAITDAGVGELAGLQKLQVLALRKTKLTDKVIPNVAKLKGLRVVYADVSLEFFPVDPKAMERKPAIPGLKVEQ